MGATYLAVATVPPRSPGAAGQSKAGEIISSLEEPIGGVGMNCNTPGQAQTYLDLRAKGVSAYDVMRRLFEVQINVVADFDGFGWKAIPEMAQYAVMEAPSEAEAHSCSVATHH